MEKVLKLKGDGEFLLEILLCVRCLMRVSSNVENTKVTLIVYSDDPNKSVERVAEQSKIEFCLHQYEGVLAEKINVKY